MIPRIRGKVGQATDPAEVAGKWFFELSMWDYTGEKMVGEPWTIGPWETEAKAHEEMLVACRIACETIEKAHGEEPSGKFLDMKNGGVLRPWESH